MMISIIIRIMIRFILPHRGPGGTHRRRRWVHWLSFAPLSVGGFIGGWEICLKVLPTNNQIYLTLPPCWGNGGGMGWGGAGLS